jgi:translation initiation factor 1
MASNDDDVEFNDFLQDLDKDQVRIIIRVELRRFRKPTTLISGLPKERNSLEKVSRELKKKLATGGTAKDGLVILQGDHREAAKEILLKLGYSASNIEVQ